MQQHNQICKMIYRVKVMTNSCELQERCWKSGETLWNEGIVCVKRLCLGIMAAARYLMCRVQGILWRIHWLNTWRRSYSRYINKGQVSLETENILNIRRTKTSMLWDKPCTLQRACSLMLYLKQWSSKEGGSLLMSSGHAGVDSGANMTGVRVKKWEAEQEQRWTVNYDRGKTSIKDFV